MGAALSLGAHAGLILAVLTARPPPLQEEPQLMNLVLLDLTPPATPAPGPAPGGEDAPKAAAEKPTPVKTPPRIALRRPAPAPPGADPLPAGAALAFDAADDVSEAALAGAATAGSGSGAGEGSGPGGGGCNMPRRLQAALRNDHHVRAAMSAAHRGKPVMVWNGDWVRRAGQEGNGLAAVREAMMWEIGFAPEACRAQRVQGLVLLSMDDAPGSARIVLGAGDWRWSDLLFSGAQPGTVALSRR